MEVEGNFEPLYASPSAVKMILLRWVNDENWQFSENGVGRAVSMPGIFKSDNLQSFEPMFFQKYSTFSFFILGGQFLLPQRPNDGKREFIQPQKVDEKEGFQCL